MATRKISALTTGTTAQNTDKIPIERSGANYYITPAMLATLIGGGGSNAGLVARYHLAADLLVTIGGIITFDTQDYDPDSTVTTGASWHFTAPATAWYEVKLVNCRLDPNGNTWVEGSYMQCEIYKNGSAYQNLVVYDPPANSTVGDPWPWFSGSSALSLTAGDTLRLQTTNFTTQDRKLAAGSAIEIYRVT